MDNRTRIIEKPYLKNKALKRKNEKMNAIVIFISGHGFGHASRMRQVLRALKEKQKEHPFKIILVTPISSLFFSGFLENTIHLPWQHDVGLLQTDSTTTEPLKTLKVLEIFEKKASVLLGKLLLFCKNYRISCVLSDISSFAFRFSKKMGVPGFFVGNFTWADIYRDLCQEYSNFSPHIARIEEEYRCAQSAFQLPWHTDLLPFESSKPLSLIAPKPSSMSQKIWESITQHPFEVKRKIVLLSFGGFDVSTLPMDTIASLKKDYLFISTHPLGSHTPENLISLKLMIPEYLGLIKYADIVMTKPGYGILVDCLVEKKPVIHTERGRFAEYPILRKFLDEQFPSVFLSKTDFFQGHWKEALDQALQIPKKFPKLPLHGAEELIGHLSPYLQKVL
jgi:hypothetical protein